MNNNIAILISGGIRLHKENKFFLHKIFENYKISIISSVWENQANEIEFKKLYELNYLKNIKLQNWDKEISNIKYVTGEENRSYKTVNIFHMWHSIVENIKYLKDLSENNDMQFDYVCRFRSDIISESENNFLDKELKKLKENEVLFPINFHNRGLNDLFFIAKYKTFLKFENMIEYINIFINEERPMNPEYLFYCFIKKNNFKIKLIDNMQIDILDSHKKTHDNYELKPTKKAHIPFKDKINLKIIKYKIRILRLLKKFNFY